MAGMLRRSRRSAERGVAVVVLSLVHVEPGDLVGDRRVSGGVRRGCWRAWRVTLQSCPGAVSAPQLAAEAANREPVGHHDHAPGGYRSDGS